MNLLAMILADHEGAPGRLDLALRALDGSLARVAKAEAVDLSQLRGAIAERPELAHVLASRARRRSGKHSSDTSLIGFRAPTSARDALFERASNLGTEPSEILRGLLDRWLKNPEQSF